MVQNAIIRMQIIYLRDFYRIGKHMYIRVRSPTP